MSAQEATPTPTALPVTPAPEHATLPTLSGAIASPNYPHGHGKEQDRIASSNVAVTPPLSSQQLAPPSRSITPSSRPPTSHLSSPPLTVGARIDVTRAVEKDILSVSSERIRQASPEGLRSIIADLMPALQEARTDAAHYRLQYQMLTIESAEAVERIQVEMDMAQRELEVLQATEQQQEPVEQQPSPLKAAEVDPSVRSIHVDLYNAIIKEIQDLKSRDFHHEATIALQKRMIVQQESEIASMTDRIVMLRERLQENRDHLNRYRRGTSAMPEGTPRSERSTPYRAPSATYGREQRPFAALLHATDLMSHQPPATPSTPKRKRTHGPSMPTTPQTVQPRMSHNAYETPQSSHTVHLKVPMSAPAPRMPFLANIARAANEVQRAHESDGTVSASDDSEAETEVPDQEDHLAESQASLLASDLLRTPTRLSTQRNVSGGQPLTQSRLFGQVKKSGLQREDAERQTKRARAGSDSVDLGIAGFREA